MTNIARVCLSSCQVLSEPCRASVSEKKDGCDYDDVDVSDDDDDGGDYRNGYDIIVPTGILQTFRGIEECYEVS